MNLPIIRWNYVYALIRLFRFPNLAIIILVQVLLRFSILKPMLFNGNTSEMMGTLDFILLVAASVLIAAAGYIINDYRDVPADHVNRPGKNPFEKEISPTTGMILYWILNGVAVLAGAYLAYRFHSMLLGLVFPCFALLLWFYSAKYKQMLITGNIVVAFLSAMVVMIIWYAEFLHLRMLPDSFAALVPELRIINFYFMGYALFAFLVTMIREIIKDMEDEEGDRLVGCRTLTVVAGRKIAARTASAVIVLTVLILAFVMYVFLKSGENHALWYLGIAVQLPLVYLAVKVFSAKNGTELHFLSNLCKIIMVAGILSMQLI